MALLHRRYGSINPRPGTQGRKPVWNDKQRDQLIELAGRLPDLTLAEMKARLRLRCCQTTVLRGLRKAGFSFKRSLSKLASNSAKTRRAINSIKFTGFIEEFLAPQLKPGDLVVMDNLSVHKVKGVEEALHAVGDRAWFLPPCTPDFNPIEPAWQQAKS